MFWKIGRYRWNPAHIIGIEDYSTDEPAVFVNLTQLREAPSGGFAVTEWHHVTGEEAEALLWFIDSDGLMAYTDQDGISPGGPALDIMQIWRRRMEEQDNRQARLEHFPGVDAPAGYPFRPEDAAFVGYDPAEER